MNYYDSSFRKNLLELLSSCRKMLQQVELSSTDKNYNFFITDTIKKVDEACKIISPSPFDFLTEKKIKKLQSDEFLKQKTEEIREKVKQEYREQLTKEIQEELMPKIKEEYKQEREIKKAKKKARKAKALEYAQQKLSDMAQEAQAKTSEDNNIGDSEQQQVFEIDSDDGFDNLPELENLE